MLSILEKLRGTIDKELGEIRRMMSHQIETINKKENVYERNK